MVQIYVRPNKPFKPIAREDARSGLTAALGVAGMEFIDVKWRHDNQEAPVRLVSELDEQRYEARKLEFFSNGVVGFASASESSGDTALGVVPIPPICEINADPQFSAATISAVQFEALWAQHATHP